MKERYQWIDICKGMLSIKMDTTGTAISFT